MREEPGETEPPSSFDPAIAEEAYRVVTAGGLNRALLMPRFMQVLMRTRWYERKLFLESLIAGEDVRAVRDFGALGLPTDTGMYLAVLAMIGPVALAVTTSLNINFLRKPALGELTVETTLLKLGKRLAVGEVSIRSASIQEGPVSHATVTYSIPAAR